MTDLFDNKYQPGRILIQTVGSGGPGNSWVSAIATKQIKSKVQVWYHPDLTEEYEDECEPFILGTIKGELDARNLISFLNSNKPDDFYFDEITIKGVKGLWKDLINISLSGEYTDVLEQLLSLKDNDLKRFNKKEGPFVENDLIEIDILDRINELLFDRLDETGKSNLTLSELLNHTDLKEKLSLDALEEQIEIWVEEEEELHEKILAEKEAKATEIKLIFKEDIEFAIANYQKYSDLEDNFHDEVSKFLNAYINSNLKLPDKIFYYFHCFKSFRDTKFIRNRTFRNNPTITSTGFINFKQLFDEQCHSNKR